MSITKHTLKGYRDDKLALAQIGRRIEELETRLYELRSPSLSGMPHSSQTESGSPQEREADRSVEDLDKLRARYAEQSAVLAARCLQIETALERLPQRYRTLMRAYYIEGLKWATVADMLHYSWETAMRMHRRALDIIKKAESEDNDVC